MRSLFAPLALAVLCTHAPLARAQAPTALTLHHAVSLAQTHNPDLANARLELQAMEAAQAQASASPNPDLSVLIEDARNATRTTTLQWSQPIELGGKRSARMATAANAHKQALVALLAKRAELDAAVTSRFFEALGAQEQVRLAQSALELASTAATIAAKRLHAGKVPPLELSKAQLAQAGAQAELAQAKIEALLARQRLALLWGEAELKFADLDGRVDILPELPSEQAIAAQLKQAPAVQLAALEIERWQALTDAERAKRVPDLTVTLGAKRDAEQGRTQAIIGLSMPLPFMDTNQGNLTQALRRQDQAHQALMAATLKLRADVSQALERLRLARAQAQTLREQALPVAQFAYDAALKGYELGKFAFLEVLDAQRSVFQLRQQILRQAADAHRANAELARLLGTPVQPDHANQETKP